jgi:4-amino-4-deoxy-L-arabinose transferase-like glycosyltransferase
LFTEKLINGATFDWITSSELLRLSVMYAYRGLLYAAGLWTLFYSFKANWYLFKRVKGFWWHRLSHKKLDNEQWLLLYIAASAVAILISAGLSPTVFGYWHLIMLYPFAAMNMLVYLTHHKVEPKNFWRYLMLIGVFSIFVNIVAAHDSVKFTYKVPYADQVEAWLVKEKL